MAHPFDALNQEQYISLTTYKKDGTPKATPVWFVRDGDKLYVWTEANSFKVKRLNNNPQCEIAPCTANGTLTGASFKATGIVKPEQAERVFGMIKRKYGLFARMFGLMNFFRPSERAALELSAS